MTKPSLTEPTMRPKRALKKPGLAERYSSDTRTVDRMVKDKRPPPPDFYLGRIPFWYEETLDKNDRAAALRPPPKNAAKATA